ncbi:alpha-2-macroglobulin family protein [Aegicerativicinus sediminis]|uniref:alpha-2-macroglobulin family protein n=1 Tax=Aegicerativicinus sediminis TaxID=2893202 RepID=UPI001E60DC8D|nr:MG2 domain-containing protein [Aegicerativicinus sediminis]
MLKYFFIVFLFISFNFYAQDFNYQNEWDKVYENELKSLPKSALEIVNNIYAKAKKDGNKIQLSKTLIYQSKFTLTLEENAQLSIIDRFRKEISTTKSPEKNLLESMLAEIFWQYYQTNRWKILERTKTEEKVDAVDFRTWDAQTIFQEIHKHYIASLKNKELLQRTGLTQYNQLLDFKLHSKKYRPTLYDFLAHRALDYYKDEEYTVTRPNYAFKLNSPEFLGDNSSFLEYKITSLDTLSEHLNALRIFKDVSKFHLNNPDVAPLIDITLKRLKFVYQNTNLENKDSLYEKSLKNLKETFVEYESSTEIDYALAQLYVQQANRFESEMDDNFRLKKTEAVAICKEAIAQFPKSFGAIQCTALMLQITKPELELQLEKFLPTSTPSRILVNFKGIDSLHFKVFKIRPKELEDFKKIYKDSIRIAFINSLEEIKNWFSSIPDPNDYNRHSTEIKLPALKQGLYLVVATLKNEINKDETFAFQNFQVTDFALISDNHGAENSFQLVDRVTGKPIVGAAVTINNTQTDKYNRPINKSTVTDEKGYFSFMTYDYHRNVSISIRKNSSEGRFGDYYFYERSSNNRTSDDEIVQIKPFIFTDRSIYRPGQTVYFKAIVLQTKGEETKPFTNEFVEIMLEDPNGQEIKTMELKLNDYGSVAGQFILPSSGLNGEYTISVDESYEHDSKFYDEADFDFEFTAYHTISVEEYKRPKFEVEFKPITETFRLGDSIQVSGNALAFAGSNIGNAKVAYRVVRTSQLPIWRRWNSKPRFTSEEMEIANGETTTERDGSFKIVFKAIPDENIPERDQPTFSYKIYADVTDINGETRSSETAVKVGYHALSLSAEILEVIDRQQKRFEIGISAKNLNGQPIETSGTIKIYKLQSPKNPFRTRPWAAPEIPGFTEKEFRELFPYDAFKDEESDNSKWPKGALIKELNFNTANSSKITIEGIKQWIIGGYLLELETTDNFGQKVKNEQRFKLIDNKSHEVADSELISVNLDKTMYKIGDEVLVTVSSASEEIHITFHVEKENKIVQTRIIALNNESKTFKVPISKTDYEGFAIQYHFVSHNGFANGVKIVNVINVESKFDIETLTFRDKIQPGSKETWGFKISGEKNEKIAAEVLASMYDASLDDFRMHQWQFNPITTSSYYSWARSNANNSFEIDNFIIVNRPYGNNQIQQKHYDELNWFGFNINNNKWVNNRYLNELKNQPKNDRTSYDKIIYGVIKDESGLPLPGANILVKGTTYGTQTDFDGQFSIKVKNGEQLVITYIGYVSEEYSVGTQKELEIFLEEDSSALEEVVVMGYGIQTRTAAANMVLNESVEADEEVAKVLNGNVAGVEIAADSMVPGSAPNVMIRGAVSLANSENVLYVVDGVIVPSFDISGLDVSSLNVLKGNAATSIYGAAAANGAIIITTKSGQAKIDADMAKIRVRENFNETAFFYPQLKTDKEGTVSFEFTMPEALTRWKLQLLAHTEDLKTATKTLSTITQKDLMVLPNVPRFLREGDSLVLATKISNLSNNSLQGTAQLTLEDGLTGKTIDNLLGNLTKNQTFVIDAKGNTSIQWKLSIPENLQAITYRISAKAGDFTDGEQNFLPVLTNRTLVTETLPMWVKGNETKTFELEKLKNNTSTTLTNYSLTLEVTSNPVWYAVQSLPYLMEYPFECSEQIFSRFYANSLGQSIANSNPKIKEVFDQWGNSEALVSNLEKNPELKSIVIQETPWLREAQSESEQKKRIALLFDLNKMGNELNATIDKLGQMQLSNGSFPWFKGSQYPNRYITQHVATGFGHLKQLQVELPDKAITITEKAISSLDKDITTDYNRLKEQAREIKGRAKTKAQGLKAEKEFWEANHTNVLQIQYLYMRSFFKEKDLAESSKTAMDYYTKQSAKYWQTYNLYTKGLIALIQNRIGDKAIAKEIYKSLGENSITSDELGMYWKENKSGWLWHEAPVETQALMIEVFSEIGDDPKVVDELRVWLLKNKQTNHWNTTKATTEAIYSLLLKGSDWTSNTELAEVSFGSKKINPFDNENTKIEAGTGYYKLIYRGTEIRPEMADVSLSKTTEGIAWGALYWQYFENLDKITSAETPLSLKKNLFKKINTDRGESLVEIDSTNNLEVGDLIRVRIGLRSDRDMEFLHMKDLRASGLEPVDVLSEYKWQDGLGYYQTTKDASTNFFYDRLPKGVYVFEYDLRVAHAGNFSNGITTIECMYAPEFKSHSEGVRISVKETE